MEKLLIIFGVYLCVFPKMLRKTFFDNEIKYYRITQGVGVCTLLVGILHIVLRIESGSMPYILLAGILFMWNIVIMHYKWKKDRCLMSKIMCVVCIILFMAAIAIVIISVTKIISSILMLIGSLIILYIPYSKVEVETR